MKKILGTNNNCIFYGNKFSADLDLLFRDNVINGKNIVLVTGVKSFNDSNYKYQLFKLFEKYKVNILHEIVVRPNPRIKDVKSTVFKEEKIDIVFCVGGGSVIDYGKLLKLYHLKNSSLMVIYTMPGSGTIVTPFAVVDDKGFKIAEHSLSLIPKLSYINEEIIYSIPFEKKIMAMGDIYSHAIESLLSNSSTKSTRLLSKKAISILIKILDDLEKNKSAINANDIVRADILAARAESQAFVLFPHAVGHYLTYYYKVPHSIASLYSMKKYLNYLKFNKISINPDYLMLLDKIIWRLKKIGLFPKIKLSEDDKNNMLKKIKKHMSFVFSLSPLKINENEYKKLI